MKNSVVLFCTFCTLICTVIFIDGVVNFSTLPTCQFVIRLISVIFAFIGLLNAYLGSKKH